ncbi:MAG: hypothetical protein RL368_1901 [Pseudomonadota bacterium]|jgi:two-component system C4-dicarboxylate transport sensor histidine kinase DctB
MSLLLLLGVLLSGGVSLAGASKLYPVLFLIPLKDILFFVVMLITTMLTIYVSFVLIRLIFERAVNFIYSRKIYKLAYWLYYYSKYPIFSERDIDSCYKLANICQFLGKIEESEKYYTKTLELITNKYNLISNINLLSIESIKGFEDIDSVLEYLKVREAEELATLEKELKASQNREAEQRADLEHAKKLEYLNYMAGGVAHNINNPVGILRLAAQRGLRELEKELYPKKAQEIFQRILTQADRLHNIIQNFRDYAKGDREKRETVALNAVVEQVQDYFSNQLAAHQIELITELAAENPHIEANHFVLQEVLINLLSNARDALENQPNAQIIITTWQQTEKVGINVADNGAGIPLEQQKSLFSPFHTTKAHGTGLGLNFAQKAVHELHGTIRYQENSPQGACFVIEFLQNTSDNIPIS